MIRFAEKEMQPALKALWHEAFGDEDDYIALFFSKRFKPKNTLVWIDDGRPAAMLHLLPAELRTASGSLPARYVYAVATKGEFRGKGISTALLEHAAELARQSGELLMLVPSSAALYDFYGKRGYQTFFYLNELTLDFAGKAEPVGYEMITPEEYKKLRDSCFDAPGYVVWDEEAIAYAINENAHGGGMTTAFHYNGKIHFAMFIKVGETLRVKETSLAPEEILPALGAAAESYRCSKILVRLPSRYNAGDKRFGMLYDAPRADTARGYLNLALD